MDISKYLENRGWEDVTECEHVYYTEGMRYRLDRYADWHCEISDMNAVNQKCIFDGDFLSEEFADQLMEALGIFEEDKLYKQSEVK